MPTVEYLNYEILDDHGWDINDDDLFEKASEADLSRENHGSLTVGEGDFILDAVEAANLEWPYSCRTAACANCAAKVVDGDVDMAMQMIIWFSRVLGRQERKTSSSSITSNILITFGNALFEDRLCELR
jgi:ferredoxin